MPPVFTTTTEKEVRSLPNPPSLQSQSVSLIGTLKGVSLFRLVSHYDLSTCQTDKKHHMKTYHWKKKSHGGYYYYGDDDMYHSHDGYYPYHPHYPPGNPYPSPVSPPASDDDDDDFVPTIAPSFIPVISVLSVPPTTTPATVSPTTVVVNSEELDPPDDVVTRTPPPLESVEKLSIQSNTLSFRASGTNDLGAHEVLFFEEVERVLAPYARSEIGPQLTKFLLSIVFEHDKLDVVSLGITGQHTLYRSIFQISTVFDLEGTPEDISWFNSEDGTEILEALFKDQMLQRILLGLNNRGIRISNIALYDPEEDSATDREPEIPVIPHNKAEEPTSKKSSRSVLLITLFSGGLVVLAVGLALLINLRRRQRYFHYGETVARSSYASYSSSSSGNSNGVSKVQRAALATKSYNSSDFLRPIVTTSSTLAPVLDDIEQSYSDYYNPSGYEEEKNEVEPLDPPASFLPHSDQDSTGAIGATLTNLNGGDSVGDLNETYPEFEMFVGLKQPTSPETQYDIPPESPPQQTKQGSPVSPYWSVDGAIRSASEVDDEEYLEDRRRWQDEANDIGLETAPDHASREDHSASDDNSAEESERGWSDENESYDVQILPELD